VFIYFEPPCSIPVTASTMSVSIDETPVGRETLAVLSINDPFEPKFHELLRSAPPLDAVDTPWWQRCGHAWHWFGSDARQGAVGIDVQPKGSSND
jgi:hypothetical protein